MYRFMRTASLKQMAQLPEAIQFAARVVEHLGKEHQTKLQFGSEIYGHAKLYWYNDFESLDQLAERQGRLREDKAYWALLDSSKHLWVDGSVRDRVVNLLG